MNRAMLFASLGILLHSALAHTASAEPQSLSTQAMRETYAPRWGLLAATSGSWLEISGREFTQSASGNRWSFGVTLSFIHPSWILDTELGYSSARATGKVPGGLDVEIKNRLGYFEMSPRYRLSERFDIGPVVELLFGADSRFSTGAPASSSTPSTFIGGKVSYQLSQVDWLARLQLKISTDLDLSQRQVTQVAAGLQLGLPVAGGPRARARDRIYGDLDRAKRIDVSLRGIQFETGKAALIGGSQRALTELAQVLLGGSLNWSKLEISGHADQRGALEKNQTLSELRALAVKDYLVSQGIPVHKLSARGFGEARPLDARENISAWEKNRRIDLALEVLSDIERAEKKLKR